ncbi:hypothetical protein HaLaN_10604 [Haematococcus lacustris]|uniref:Uncharacterized protein n=1 Tax=Haematococcus lacustris TaxID=44745 RepID=A0A699YY28_HAELA|nr:hypothetical protein HaLaN_10604 [Haematococcus lacustris]
MSAYTAAKKPAVVQARRREADLTVALRSAQRRPQSALQQVISGHLAPGQVPVWGPGHSKGYSLPPSRPATASTQGGPMLSRSHGASMTRPSSTQPTIQVLSALFQDQGLTS